MEARLEAFGAHIDENEFQEAGRFGFAFGVWLLLGLEFELAADIVRTAISPTWDQLGQLASIAVIRTFLNHFLEKDIEKYQEANPGTVSTVNERAA